MTVLDLNLLVARQLESPDPDFRRNALAALWAPDAPPSEPEPVVEDLRERREATAA